MRRGLSSNGRDNSGRSRGSLNAASSSNLGTRKGVEGGGNANRPFQQGTGPDVGKKKKILPKQYQSAIELDTGIQPISPIFFLPQSSNSPSHANSVVATPPGPDVGKTGSIRQTFLSLQRKIDHGNLKGVKLESLSGPRCIAHCRGLESRALLQSLKTAQPQDDDTSSHMTKARSARVGSGDMFSVRILVTFSLKTSDFQKRIVPKFTMVPRTFSDNEYLNHALDKINQTIDIMSQNKISNPTETLLRLTVYYLTCACHGELPKEEGLPHTLLYGPRKTSGGALFPFELNETKKQEHVLVKSNPSSSSLRTSSSDGGTSSQSVQPCPRIFGAVFSGPGLLVWFRNKGVESLIQQNSVGISGNSVNSSSSNNNNNNSKSNTSSKSTSNSNNKNDGNTSSDKTSNSGKSGKYGRDNGADPMERLPSDIPAFPRTYSDLTNLVQMSHSDNRDGSETVLSKVIEGNGKGVKESRRRSQRLGSSPFPFTTGDDSWSDNEDEMKTVVTSNSAGATTSTSPSFRGDRRATDQGINIGVREDLTQEDLFDLDLRQMNRGNSSTVNRGDTGSLPEPRSSPSLDPLSPMDEELKDEPKLDLGGHVTILDTSLLSPVNRFIGRASRLGALSDKEETGDIPSIFSPLLQPVLQGLDFVDFENSNNSISGHHPAHGMMLDDPHDRELIRLRYVQNSGDRAISSNHLAYLTDVDFHHPGAKNGLEFGHREVDRDDCLSESSSSSGTFTNETSSVSDDQVDSSNQDDLVRSSDGGQQLVSEPDDEYEDSYESLLCWYDDFSDEPINHWDNVPLGVANMYVGRMVGRFDLVQTWLLVCLLNNQDIARSESALDKILQRKNGLGPTSWALHPCGRNLLQGLFTEYEKLKDVQTLAILSCVLEDQAKKSAWKDTISLMDPQWKVKFDRYRYAYASILHQWGLNTKRAEIMSYVARTAQDDEREQLTLAATCPQCGKLSPKVLCQSQQCRSKSVLLKCVICTIGVRGLCTFCPACGHGGHAEHMKQWFLTSMECPTGCGCLCGQEI